MEKVLAHSIYRKKFGKARSDPGHESFSKPCMGRDGILFTHMVSLVISVVLGS